MPIVQTKNGEWVNVPAGTTPERISQITGGNAPPATPSRAARRSAPVSARDAEVRKRADAIQKRDSGALSDTAHGFRSGLLMGFGDELAGGLSASVNSVGNVFGLGNGKSFGDEYATARDTERLLDRRAKESSPVLNTIGELGGAVATPIGAGARLLTGAGKAAGAVGLTRAAGALAKGGARVAKAGPIAKAVLTGANQGALNAAGNATDMQNVPAAIGEGALIGGGLGGVFGGVAKLGSAGAAALRDRGAGAANRVAFGKAGERIRQARTTPAEVEAEMAASQAGGVDARFMDTSPGTRADAAYYSRKPNLDASNDLKGVSEERMMGRGSNLVSHIEQHADIPPGGTDSDALIEKIVAQRKAQGKADYAVGGALDAPVNWSDDLDKFWAEAPKDTRATMLRARSEIEGRRGDPDAYITPSGPDGEMTIVPSMRTFDYLKRGFDGEIGAAKTSGDMPKVQRLQSELSEFKRLFGEANPNDEYAQLLLRQRTGFERQSATEASQGYLQRLTSGRAGAREVLKEITSLKPHQVQDARTGILDGLLNIDAKANPLNTFRALTRTPQQRKVLEFAFGGEKQLADFTTYLNREIKAAGADGMVSGPQSITSAVQLAGDAPDETVGNIFNQVLRGYAFGGLPGAASGAFRQFGNLASGMGSHAQEAYGSLLAGNGEGLARGVESARQFGLKRAEGVTRRSRRAAKAGQQLYTDQLGKQ